jgi:hypothetical protein
MFDRKPRMSGDYLLVLARMRPGAQIARASQADSRVIHAEHAVAGEVRTNAGSAVDAYAKDVLEGA